MICSGPPRLSTGRQRWLFILRSTCTGHLRHLPRTDLQELNPMGSELLQAGGRHQASGLVDVLDRVLDKGLVIAGDIKVSLAEVELLTIRIRLIVCSIDKAQQIGLDWWRYDKHLAPGAQNLLRDNEKLQEQVRVLERKLETLTRTTTAPALKYR